MEDRIDDIIYTGDNGEGIDTAVEVTEEVIKEYGEVPEEVEVAPVKHNTDEIKEYNLEETNEVSD